MINHNKKGFSLLELLVTILIGSIVMVIILNTLFQLRNIQIVNVSTIEHERENIEAKMIFNNLIHNAFIKGNATYSFAKKLDSYVGSDADDVIPFNYPIIYAQQTPLFEIPGEGSFPDDVQVNTDILVLQSIDSAQVLNNSISVGDTSISRPIDSTTSNVANGAYMMIADETNQSLFTSNSTKTSTDGTVDLNVAINNNYPVGATLYTDYSIKVIYIKNSGNGDKDLYEMVYQSNNSGWGQVLLKGVSNMQIKYNINGTWERVAAYLSSDDKYKMLWQKRIMGIKINYDLNGKSHENIISFNGVGGLK